MTRAKRSARRASASGSLDRGEWVWQQVAWHLGSMRTVLESAERQRTCPQRCACTRGFAGVPRPQYAALDGRPGVLAGRYARAKMQKENISEMPRLAPPIPMHFRTTSPERDAFSRKMAEDARVRGTVAVEVTSN